ncbi:ATP-binding protein [Mycolicibacterium mengxianglii]|uniref:ATP-binding protein n=1 Tax=Mycolicibacterium mengxianglii TaxID=2736649 RepID=UPI0018D109A5|nr:ATP-binding protein [Mycolicibacterium mengxianglii]
MQFVAESLGLHVSDLRRTGLLRRLSDALVHASYLHENRDRCPDLTPGVLKAYEYLGSDWLGRELAVRLYLSRNFETAGEMATAHATAIQAVNTWIDSLEWPTQCVDYGKGLSQQIPSAKTRRSMVHQAVGAVVVAGLENDMRGQFEGVINDAVGAEHLQPSSLDYISAIQASAPEGSVRWVVERSGPDHDPVFDVVVSTEHDGICGRGSGRSKKDARKAAARSYFETKQTNSGVGRSELASSPVRKFSLPRGFPLPANASVAVEQLSRELALEKRWRPLVAQFLIHSSWAYENRPLMDRTQQVDNSVLGFVGSWVTQFEYTFFAATAAIDVKDEQFPKLTPTEAELAHIALSLGIDEAMLLSRGEEATRGQKPSLLANAFQALLAVAYVATRTSPLLSMELSPRWRSFRESVSTRNTRSVDYKTALQEFAAACDLSYTFDVSSDGKEHNRSFFARLNLDSSILGKRTSIRGSTATSRKGAEQQSAKILVETTAALGATLIHQPMPQIRGTVFIVSHLLATAQAQPSLGARWARLGILGADIADRSELVGWAHAIDSIAANQDSTSIDPTRLSEFYRHSAAAGRTSGGLASKKLLQVTRRLLELDSIDNAVDIERDLVSLGALYRAAGQSAPPSSVEDAVSDWQLLYRDKMEVVQQVPTIELSASERSTLDFLFGRFAENSNSLVLSSNEHGIQIDTCGTDVHPGFADLVALFGDLSERMKLAIQGDVLSIAFLTDGMSAGPVSRAVQIALEPQPSSLSRSIANTLHDLKNQMAASRQAAAITVNMTRTQQLSRQLISSQHLDQAQALARQLQAVQSMLSPPAGYTEVSSYLRSYAARLMERLPAAFTVAFHGQEQPITVAVDETYLAAILDNLVKNTQEALDTGGRLELSVAEVEDEVRIVFQDDGPGVPPEVLAALRAGQSVQSTKLNGNGLGLVGVQELVRKAGGLLEYDDTHTGACWRITLPTIATMDMEELR